MIVYMSKRQAAQLRKIFADPRCPPNRHKDGENVFAGCACKHCSWLRKEFGKVKK